MDITWEKIIGCGAMAGDNEKVLIRGCQIMLKELGHDKYLRDLETRREEKDGIN